MPKSSMPKKEDKDIKQAFSEAFGGILGGLGEIIQRLGELAEKGEEIKKGGEFKIDSNVKSREMKGVYGFSIKTGLGGKEPKVEPFGNIRQDKATGRAVVEEVRGTRAVSLNGEQNRERFGNGAYGVLRGCRQGSCAPVVISR